MLSDALISELNRQERLKQERLRQEDAERPRVYAPEPEDWPRREDEEKEIPIGGHVIQFDL